MTKLIWIVPLGFFLLNPAVACGPAESQFQYGAVEMRAAVEGDWSFTITPDRGTATQITLHIDEAATAADGGVARAPGRGLLRAAYACGTRTLVKSAGACIDATQMPLALTFVSGDATLGGGHLSGMLTVGGLIFTTVSDGALSLTIGPYDIESMLGPDGTLGAPHLGPGGNTGTLVVSRL
jgi:hypothetical protein